MDRRDTSEQFRQRLLSSMENANLTRAGLAKRIGVDRSTLSQILSSDSTRLPRADTVASIATTLKVSVDWLLGLREMDERDADILDYGPEISPTTRAPEDENLRRWFSEARGYKIRYVPLRFPDPLKIREIIDFEFRENRTQSVDQAQVRSEDRLEYVRLPETDMEICSPIQDLQAFAEGTGYWQGLPLATRKKQLEHMAGLSEELYPTLRWYLYDGLTDYAAPVTIFGPKRAALYTGNMYMVFTTTDHVRAMTRRFDELIRRAVVQANDISGHIQKIVETMET